MGNYVKKLEVLDLFGRMNVVMDFFPDINVVYGRNGSGKTTMLHIIANLLSGAIQRFLYLDFRVANLEMGEGSAIKVVKSSDDNALRKLDVSLNGELYGTMTLNLRNPVIEPETGGREGEVIEWRGEGSPPIDQEGSEHVRAALGISLPAYFPAFRTMIEAWATVDSERRFSNSPASRRNMIPRGLSSLSQERVTTLARELFGPFVPALTYPSPNEIQFQLVRELERAALLVANEAQELLTQAFIDAFAAVLGGSTDTDLNADDLLDRIRHLLQQMELRQTQLGAFSPGIVAYEKLRELVQSAQPRTQPQIASRVLAVYCSSLEKTLTVQETRFQPIQRYLDAVNQFLEEKHLEISSSLRYRDDSVQVAFNRGGSTPWTTLSSGERQIVSMLYAATRIGAERDVILIDEPELSLHVEWQNSLLERMAQQLEGRQLIVSTHSPDIGAKYREHYKELKPEYHEFS